MVVHDFNVYGIAIQPDETNSPLIIGPDAVLLFRFPRSASNRFAGGTRRSFIDRALFSILSLRRAICRMLCGSRFERIPFQIFSVSLERKLLIMDRL
jgi:hypothetical protein